MTRQPVNVAYDIENMRGAECPKCGVSLSEWKDEKPYTECPLCGYEDLIRGEWGD